MKRQLRTLATGFVAFSTIAMASLVPMASAASYTCTWTGAGTDSKFSTAANWSGCNGAAPNVSDTNDLVFPVTVTNLAPVNDLTGATFNSITFNGTGASGYDITGNSFTLAGNITDAASISAGSNALEPQIIINGATTIDTAQNSADAFPSAVTGTGSITKNGLGMLTFEDLQITGALNANGAGMFYVHATSSADATFSGVSISAAGHFNYDAFVNSGITTYTFTKPITTAGGDIDFTTLNSAAGLVLNVTGPITLTADATLDSSSNETVNLLGTINRNGHTLTTQNTVNYNNATSSNSSAPSDTTAAKAPNTGFALAAAHPAITAVATLALTGALFFVSRRTFAKAGVRR